MVKTSRYAQLAKPQVVVGLDGERLHRVSRLVPNIREGIAYLHAAFPTPNKLEQEQLVNISFMLDSTALCKPFSEAFLAIGLTLNPGTREERAGVLKRGFFAFLAERDMSHIDLGEISTVLINQFIVWLNQTENEVAKWAPSTRRLCYGGLRTIMNQLKAMEQWRDKVPRNLYMREAPWPGSYRKIKPTEVIARDDFAAIYRACVTEIEQCMSEVREGRRLIASQSIEPLAQCDGPGRHYKEFGVCLATLAAHYPDGLLSTMKQGLSNTHQRLWLAIDKHHTLGNVAKVFYPSPRHLVPFALLLAIHFAYNPDTVLGSKLSDYRKFDLLGQSRLQGVPFKGRAGRNQIRTVAVDEASDNPSVLIDFLTEWTQRIRRAAHPCLQDRLFLYVPATASRRIGSFENAKGSSSDGNWKSSLRAFIRENGLVYFKFIQIRHTVLDTVHELFGGDLKAVMAAGQQRTPGVILSHYTSDAARMRNAER